MGNIFRNEGCPALIINPKCNLPRLRYIFLPSFFTWLFYSACIGAEVLTFREPFGKVTEMMQVPIALYEILALAGEIDDPKAKQIARLVENVIEVTFDDPEALIKLSSPAFQSG